MTGGYATTTEGVWRLALCGASAKLIAECGGVESVSDLLGVRQGDIRAWLDPLNIRAIDIGYVVKLEEACGVPHVSSAMALAHGLTVTPYENQDIKEMSALDVANDLIVSSALAITLANNLAHGRLSDDIEAGLVGARRTAELCSWLVKLLSDQAK